MIEGKIIKAKLTGSGINRGGLSDCRDYIFMRETARVLSHKNCFCREDAFDGDVKSVHCGRNFCG
jgi:hypothetical protein